MCMYRLFNAHVLKSLFAMVRVRVWVSGRRHISIERHYVPSYRLYCQTIGYLSQEAHMQATWAVVSVGVEHLATVGVE